MQWFEYDKAEEMLEAIKKNMKELENDIQHYKNNLSRTSLLAMENEFRRLDMHFSDIKEMLYFEDSQKNPTILESSS